MFDCVTLSDHVTVHGAVPVNVFVTGAVCPDPAVMVPPPLTVAEVLHPWTVTSADPVALPEQPVPSTTLMSVYVVVAPGETSLVKGFCVMFDCVTLSDQVIVHGPVPAKVTVTGAVCPEPPVMVPPPLTAAEALQDCKPVNVIIPGRLMPLLS